MKLGYIAFDQYGSHYTIKKHPRKELTEMLGSSHVDKMYRDTKDGAKHVGYIISGLWLEIFSVNDWSK